MIKFKSSDQLIRLVSNGNERHRIWIPRSYLLWSHLIEEVESELAGLSFDGINCPFPVEDLSNFFQLVEHLAFSTPVVKFKFISDLIQVGLFFKMKKIFWMKFSEIPMDIPSKNKVTTILRGLSTKKDSKIFFFF